MKQALILTAFMAGAPAPSSSETVNPVIFSTRDAGEKKQIHEWGIDATWASEHNTRESVKNAGSEIDFVRVGFYMHQKYNEDGSLSANQIRKLDHALDYARIVGKNIPIMISPHNEAKIIDWYKNSDGSANIDRWYNVMEKNRIHIENRGHKVVYVEAFNEPDYARWNMGTREDLDKLFERLKPWQVLRVGPSVMSSEWAGSWYGAIKRNVDAGGCHTLYGTMGQFIAFADEITKDRKKFACPESHSIAEAMVGAEAGATCMAWWGPIDEARAHFMRACQGSRLAFVRVERNWSAACVYRAPDGTLHGFVGSAERENGKTTTYNFVCSDKDATYYPDGDMTKGQFRKQGEAFVVEAKPPKGTISQWLKIAPGQAGQR